MVVLRNHWISILLVIGLVSVIVAWLFLPAYILTQHGNNYEKAGAHGDIYGAVNALFTSLAFALLIYTALMQREELSLQRKELELTRTELEKAAKAQIELVRLTQENNDLQKYARRSEVYPEAKIVSQDFIKIENGRVQCNVSFTPKFYAMRIMDVLAYNGIKVGMYITEFDRLFKGRLIPIGDTFFISLQMDNEEHIDGVVIELRYQDADGHPYKQKITHSHGVFYAASSVSNPTIKIR
jgi:hypothetical protein